jgi:hypothetical protein
VTLTAGTQITVGSGAEIYASGGLSGNGGRGGDGGRGGQGGDGGSGGGSSMCSDKWRRAVAGAVTAAKAGVAAKAVAVETAERSR